jgi:hypothetical protein
MADPEDEENEEKTKDETGQRRLVLEQYHF